MTESSESPQATERASGTPGPIGSRREPSRLLLAAWFGLIGGVLDLVMIVVRRDVLHVSPYFEQGRHFLWTVPAANLVIMLGLGLLVAMVHAVRPGSGSIRVATFLFATLAVWGPLLRMPIHGLAGLVVGIGVARLSSGWIARHASGFARVAAISTTAMLALLVATAAVSLRRQAIAESGARAALPTMPAGRPNILLIVLDTVRADSLGLHGYGRATTPLLDGWAQKGVRFDRAASTAPWTFPSHSSMFTGRWPSTIDAHWKPVLDPMPPTLAGFLAGRGYLTAGFAANTHWCSYESGLDRGFVHYEDYPLTPRLFLACTMPGRWLLEDMVGPREPDAPKWIRAQSRDAAGIGRAFLDWLDRDLDPGRPFFAFLNLLDAHEPFLAPFGVGQRFGRRPRSAAERRMLLEYWDLDKLAISPNDVELARDAYDDCISALDVRLDDLLRELERRGALDRTVVIVTSDHGEQFGEHGVFNHGFSVYEQEVHVPLMILGPAIPAGRAVAEPVSLRDLPATIADLSGFAAESPFPGRSLASRWRSPPGEDAIEPTSAAYSEVDIPEVILPQRGRGPKQRGFTVSLMERGEHYLLDSRGAEELYDLAADPLERRDVRNDVARWPSLERLRAAMGAVVQQERASTGLGAAYLKQLRSLLGSMAPRPRL